MSSSQSRGQQLLQPEAAKRAAGPRWLRLWPLCRAHRSIYATARWLRLLLLPRSTGVGAPRAELSVAAASSVGAPSRKVRSRCTSEVAAQPQGRALHVVADLARASSPRKQQRPRLQGMSARCAHVSAALNKLVVAEGAAAQPWHRSQREDARLRFGTAKHSVYSCSTSQALCQDDCCPSHRRSCPPSGAATPLLPAALLCPVHLRITQPIAWMHVSVLRDFTTALPC